MPPIWADWRAWIYDFAQEALFPQNWGLCCILNITTHRGSTAIANRAGTPCPCPSDLCGREADCIFVSYFVFSEAREAGVHLSSTLPADNEKHENDR